MDLSDPRLYVNRELSWLEFNQRVLDEASDPNNPLLEQLKFLAIVSSNLDEFFMVRVAGVMRQVAAGAKRSAGEVQSPPELLAALRERIQAMVRDQYECLKGRVFAQLRAEGLRLLAWNELNEAQREAAEDFVRGRVLPAMSPVAIDRAHDLPHLHNLSSHFLVTLSPGADDQRLTALVSLPSAVPRFIPLPSEPEQTDYCLVEDTARELLGSLFLGYTVRSATLFRLTRDADLNLDEDDAEDLLHDIEQALVQRDQGNPVRLEIEANDDIDALEFLRTKLGLSANDVYRVAGPINLKDLFALTGVSGYDRLRYRPFVPPLKPELVGQDDLFEAIRRRPILLHHPYESFKTVVDFLQQAAADPQVLAIKMTLYRTSGDSPMVRALAAAAESGKQVAVLVELKARFDEAPNIRWARQLEQSGVHVVYGLVGLKTHCKVISVVRLERDGLRFYVHLGTGNYHPTTALLYTDCGLLTCDPDIGEDVRQLFNVLTGYSEYPAWRKLAVAPKDLKRRVIELIDAEADQARTGGTGRIIAKCNAILEPQVIEALYRASQAGVRIDLISRGICGLRVGVPGVSENITVRSIVGRFLEHSRIFCFGNGGDPLVFMGSADWMDRNLNRRVETMFPVEEPALRNQVIDGILATCLADTAKARILQPDGSWQRPPVPEGEPFFNSQDEFMRRSLAAAGAQGRRLGRAGQLRPLSGGDGQGAFILEPPRAPAD